MPGHAVYREGQCGAFVLFRVCNEGADLYSMDR